MNKKITAAFLLLSSVSAYAGYGSDMPSVCGGDYKNIMFGAGGIIKLHHVKGTQTCQSNENWGYTCSVQVFDATDCDNGHQRNRGTNCCQFYQNKLQTNGLAVTYTPGTCSTYL